MDKGTATTARRKELAAREHLYSVLNELHNKLTHELKCAEELRGHNDAIWQLTEIAWHAKEGIVKAMNEIGRTLKWAHTHTIHLVRNGDKTSIPVSEYDGSLYTRMEWDGEIPSKWEMQGGTKSRLLFDGKEPPDDWNVRLECH